jgi:hypothetical protein
LEVFEEQHAPFFFGREATTQHLVETLRPTHFLAILGPSGSGKSSLARAGLLPQLRRGALPSSDRWRYLLLKPGQDPLYALAQGLASVETPDEILQRLHTTRLVEALRRDERTLHRYVRDVLANQSDEERCCIIVDQFEEVLTLCHDPTTRTQFIDLLRYAATIAEGQTVVVITMRIDFLTSAAAYPPLAELLSMHPFIVSPMELADLRGVIEQPAQLMGLRFEEGLVETILQDVGPEPGALPLLEHALLQLWERQRNHVMTWQAYREIGGVRGALAKRAEQIFEALTEVQQRITRRILLRLTQPGENTADTRRRSTLEELQIQAEDRHAVEEVVKTLADARLVVASRDQQVEVAHEALIRSRLATSTAVD